MNGYGNGGFGLRGLVDGVMVVEGVVGPKDLLGCEDVLVFVL